MGGAQSTHEQMVKNLVRLALSNEFSRRPIKREDITKKVMGTAGRQQFKQVFTQADEQLRDIFGMTLKELPAREKITVSQKRAAQRAASNKASGPTAKALSQAVGASSSGTKQYILTSALPVRYRLPAILRPAQIPTTASEAGYAGFTNFVLSLICLSPGQTISESRLEKHLKRLNAETYVLGEKTDKGVLARMQREGYIIKVRERDGGGEETVEFVVGPRGKVEMGDGGVAGVVRKVYGKRDVDPDDLERRLVRTLGEGVSQKASRREQEEEEEEVEQETTGQNEESGERVEHPGNARRRTTRGNRTNANAEEEPAGRRRSRRNRREVEEEEEEEEEDDEEEDSEDEEG